MDMLIETAQHRAAVLLQERWRLSCALCEAERVLSLKQLQQLTVVLEPNEHRPRCDTTLHSDYFTQVKEDLNLQSILDSK